MDFSLCLSVLSVVKTDVVFQGQINALAYNRSESPIRVHLCSSVVGSRRIFSIPLCGENGCRNSL